MPTYARGVAKTVAISPELVAFGTQGAGVGQLLRRTRSDLNLGVQQIESQEILPSQQVRDSRNGPRQVQGTISGQLSPATYSTFFEGILRNTFASVTALAVSDTTSTLNGSGQLVVAGAAGDNFSGRFKVGDIIRPSGLTGASGTADNLDNMRVVGITTSTMTLDVPAGTLAWTPAQAGASYALPGKRLIIPATGQLDKSFTLEHWYADVAKSELFTGCKVTQIALNIPASGFVTFQASVTGQQMVETSTQVYPSATAPTTTTSLTAVSGKVLYAGLPVLYISALSLQIAASVGADPVVGSNLVPQIFLGTVMVRGSFTALATADTMTSDFLNEVETSMSILMTTSPADNAEFISIHLPRVKLTASTKNDSDKAITRNYTFVALENTGSVVGADLSSILVQDSLTP